MQVESGFTLLELLIVMLIMALIATGGYLSFGDFGGQRRVLMAAEAFSAYLKLLQQRAILSGKTLGVKLTQRGYETYSLEDTFKWRPIRGQSLFAKHNFPKDILLTWQDKPKASRLDFYLEASGEISPFSLIFGYKAKPRLVLLKGEANGELSVIKLENDAS